MAESPDNARVADTLDRVAELLELQGGNPHRARSYRRAAETVRGADREMAEVLKEKGVEGLKAFGGVGERLAGAIREIVETGRLGLLDRLESEADPRTVLAKVPGVGEELAGRFSCRRGMPTVPRAAKGRSAGAPPGHPAEDFGYDLAAAAVFFAAEARLWRDEARRRP